MRELQPAAVSLGSMVVQLQCFYVENSHFKFTRLLLYCRCPKDGFQVQRSDGTYTVEKGSAWIICRRVASLCEGGIEVSVYLENIQSLLSTCSAVESPLEIQTFS